MSTRFGEAARIEYRDVDQPGIRDAHGEIVSLIETQGLLYPVTVIDGVPVYDGAVSYPAILRAVQRRLEETGAPAE